MRILLTNDDGVDAAGLRALEEALGELGEVWVVAPDRERSGVAHSITFLTPLFAEPVHQGDRQRGWAVQGNPVDCVKLALFELCPFRPDLLVSGINAGLNAGINVLYSGTVAAAIEGAFRGVRSAAISLEADASPDYASAARLSVQVLREHVIDNPHASLFNLNLPTAALGRDSAEVKIAPMGMAAYGDDFIRRQDPKNRTYYWATNDPPPKPESLETDLSLLEQGQIVLTPLQYNLTNQAAMESMRSDLQHGL